MFFLKPDFISCAAMNMYIKNTTVEWFGVILDRKEKEENSGFKNLPYES